MVLDRTAEPLGDLPLHRIGAPEAVEGVDLHRSEALGLDVGVPRDLGDLGAVPVDAQGGDHIGVAAAHVGAQDQQILPVHAAAPGGEGIGDRGSSPRADPGRDQLGQGRRQQQAPSEADGHGEEDGSALAAPASRAMRGNLHRSST